MSKPRQSSRGRTTKNDGTLETTYYRYESTRGRPTGPRIVHPAGGGDPSRKTAAGSGERSAWAKDARERQELKLRELREQVRQLELGLKASPQFDERMGNTSTPRRRAVAESGPPVRRATNPDTSRSRRKDEDFRDLHRAATTPNPHKRSKTLDAKPLPVPPQRKPSHRERSESHRNRHRSTSRRPREDHSRAIGGDLDKLDDFLDGRGRWVGPTRSEIGNPFIPRGKFK